MQHGLDGRLWLYTQKPAFFPFSQSQNLGDLSLFLRGAGKRPPGAYPIVPNQIPVYILTDEAGKTIKPSWYRSVYFIGEPDKLDPFLERAISSGGPVSLWEVNHRGFVFVNVVATVRPIWTETP